MAIVGLFKINICYLKVYIQNITKYSFMSVFTLIKNDIIKLKDKLIIFQYVYTAYFGTKEIV